VLGRGGTGRAGQPDQRGPARASPGQHPISRTGTGRALINLSEAVGPDWAGPERAGLDRTRPDRGRAGPGWIAQAGRVGWGGVRAGRQYAGSVLSVSESFDR
jgi:hypothetical protein